MRTTASWRRVGAAVLVTALAGGCGAWKRFQYEGLGRDDWQKPEEVLALLAVGEGDRVADLGAGGGYFSFRFAEAVGPSGRVYAVDVDDDMLVHLARRAESEGRTNLEVVRAEPSDPRLPDGEIDLVFVCNTYHHLPDPSAYFRGVLTDLAPKGRVAVVELDERSWFPRTTGHFTAAEQVVAEMGAAGYRLVASHELLDRQSFLVFEPDDDTGE